MGADPKQIKDDYMQIYYNFFFINRGIKQYDYVLSEVFEPIFNKVLGVENYLAEDVDLPACTAAYFKKIGVSDEEIRALRENLSRKP